MTRASKRAAVAIPMVFLIASILVAVPAEGAHRRKCFGERATLIATGGDQAVLGTRGRDVIVGTAANDVIDGRGGNDLICGRAGDDTLAGGGGHDSLNGQNDSGFGDALIGGAGNDFLSGGGGQNPVTFANTADYVEYSGATGVNVNLSTGVATGYGTDTLVNIEQVGGTAYDDVLIGDAGFNALFGNDGNDTLDVGAGDQQLVWPGMGDDSVTGPSGSRTMVLYDDLPALTGVTIDLAAGTATGAGTDRLTNITDATGSVGNDTITGTNGPNVINSCSGTDTVNFNGNSATGTDPTPFINAIGIDVGFDQACAVTTATPGNTSYNGGSGIAMVCWCAATGPITANLQTGTATGAGTDTLSNIDGVIGGPAADTLIGSANRDFLEGTSGNDRLDGGGGDDVMIAFHMADLTVDLGAGTASGYFAGDPTLSTYTVTRIEEVWGSLDDGDILIGDNANNRFLGFGGNDTLTGNQGSDHLDGGEGTDTGDGGQGSDTCVSIETPTGCETTTASRTGHARSAAGAGIYRFTGRFGRH